MGRARPLHHTARGAQHRARLRQDRVHRLCRQRHDLRAALARPSRGERRPAQGRRGGAADLHRAADGNQGAPCRRHADRRGRQTPAADLGKAPAHEQSGRHRHRRERAGRERGDGVSLFPGAHGVRARARTAGRAADHARTDGFRAARGDGGRQDHVRAAGGRHLCGAHGGVAGRSAVLPLPLVAPARLPVGARVPADLGRRTRRAQYPSALDRAAPAARHHQRLPGEARTDRPARVRGLVRTENRAAPDRYGVRDARSRPQAAGAADARSGKGGGLPGGEAQRFARVGGEAGGCEETGRTRRGWTVPDRSERRLEVATDGDGRHGDDAEPPRRRPDRDRLDHPADRPALSLSRPVRDGRRHQASQDRRAALAGVRRPARQWQAARAHHVQRTLLVFHRRRRHPLSGGLYRAHDLAARFAAARDGARRSRLAAQTADQIVPRQPGVLPSRANVHAPRTGRRDRNRQRGVSYRRSQFRRAYMVQRQHGRPELRHPMRSGAWRASLRPGDASGSRRSRKTRPTASIRACARTTAARPRSRTSC